MARTPAPAPAAPAIAAMLLIVVCLTCAALPGCDRAVSDSERAERLDFAVADSLLGPELVFSGANKSLRPPHGFEAIPDSLLATLRESELVSFPARLVGSPGVDHDVELVSALLDTARQAGMAVSVLRGVSSDDENYADEYESALRGDRDDVEVHAGDYVVNDVYVRNFLVSDSSTVRFHLLCFSDGDDALEIVYFSSRSNYPQLVRAFESSIGTVMVIGKGG